MLELTIDHSVIVLVIMGVALLLLITGLVSTDIVALMVLVSLGLSGILDLSELTSGFGSPVILTMVGIFMLTAALEHTGVTAYLSRLLLRLTQQAPERTLVGLLALAAGLFSLAMNSFASVALIMPVGRQVAHSRNLSPSRIMLPIAFGGILGGMATLLTTANLLISDALVEQGFSGFSLLDFLPIGGPIALAGILYMMLLSPLVLPERSPSDHWSALQQARKDLTRTYALSKRLFEVQINPNSPLNGKTLAESDLGRTYGATVAAVVRGRQTFTPPDPGLHLVSGDWLLLGCRPDDAATAAQELKLTLVDQDAVDHNILFANNSELAEVALSPHSNLIGKTLAEIKFRDKYELNILAIWHEGSPRRSHLIDYRLTLGDALLVQGPPDRLSLLSQEPGLFVLTRLPNIPEGSQRAIIAMIILLVFLVVIGLDLLPVPLAALLGAIAVVVTGCETVEQAQASIRWDVLILIGGMLPLATAMKQSGAIQMLTGFLPGMLQTMGAHTVLLVVFLLTVGLAQLTSGAAASLIVGPLVIATGAQAGLNPQALAMAVAIGASTAFLSPMAHPANLLVMGPGGYQFHDYYRLGAPMVLLAAAGVLLLIPLVYPL
ncbi:MAG: SLC13 family permease [Anaerolineae bacterium]|nr:SLC13 family permease [Anaerolineae bacterium]